MSHSAATVVRQGSIEDDADLSTRISSPIRRTHRLKRLATGLLLAILAPLGVGMATAAPAQAASYVEGCFRSLTPGMGFAGTPVHLQYWNGSQWVITWTGKLNSNSCTGVNIVGNLRSYYVQLIVSERVGTAFFFGATPYYANPGNLRVNIGTGIVSCTGCR